MAQTDNGEPSEIRVNNNLTLWIKQITKDEFTVQKQTATHLRHKPYKKIENLAKVQRMLGKRMRVIDKEDEEIIIHEFEITLNSGNKRYLDNEFYFVAYYPEIKVLLFDTEGGYYSIDFKNNTEEYDVSPDNHSISPNRLFRINAKCPNNLAKDDYSYFIEIWNRDIKQYEHIGDLFSVGGYDFDWIWIDDNTILFTYIAYHQIEKERIYQEVKIKVV
ncbi:hypothetical protein [Bacteroides sp. 224]|uniref:hypothetical protein n=1 Tax=Bacteroides sp. 224 TaxID=2302936 RepID=UPI0013D428E6|nr:hypothetical protein [Bacteroides sp. 224]